MTTQKRLATLTAAYDDMQEQLENARTGYRGMESIATDLTDRLTTVVEEMTSDAFELDEEVEENEGGAARYIKELAEALNRDDDYYSDDWTAAEKKEDRREDASTAAKEAAICIRDAKKAAAKLEKITAALNEFAKRVNEIIEEFE